jgi:hypothetical protein
MMMMMMGMREDEGQFVHLTVRIITVSVTSHQQNHITSHSHPAPILLPPHVMMMMMMMMMMGMREDEGEVCSSEFVVVVV